MLKLGANVSIKTTVQTIHSCKCSPDTCSDLTLSLLVITSPPEVWWEQLSLSELGTAYM